MKTKFFGIERMDNLEREVNKWLDENNNIEIIEFKHLPKSSQCSYHYVTILYKENENTKD